jgi:site-specific recombinase XerD
MSNKIHSNLDYETLCSELGITLDELIFYINNKDSAFTEKKVIYTPVLKVIEPFKKYLVSLNKVSKRSDSTLETYFNTLDRFKAYIERTDPEITLDLLNENFILDFLAESEPRKGEKLSNNTYNKYLSIIKSMLFFCYENQYIDKDIRGRFELYEIGTLPRYLSDAQLETVIKKALQKSYGYRCRAMLTFLVGTGCRVSELVKMKVNQFNVKEKLIYVIKGKGNKDRVIPMFNEVEDEILHYLKISGTPEWDENNNGFLFCRDEGTRKIGLTKNSVQYLVRNLFKEMGMDNDYTVHTFRHTFAVNCLKSGMPFHYLQQIMGHEDPSTTQIYTELLPKDLQNEVMKYYPFPFEKLLHDILN